MTKRITFIIGLLLAIQCLQAQTGNQAPPVRIEKGYIYLKDGKILKGDYIYSPALDRIRITSGGESVVLDASEVEKISKKAPKNNRFTGTNDLEEYTPSAKNWLFLGEFGILPGNPDNQLKAPLNFHLSADYKLTSGFFAGVGAGVEFLKETYLPVTVNAIYRFNNKRVAPYITLQAGYMIPIEGSRTVVRDVMPLDNSYIMPNYVPHDMEMKAKGGLLLNPSAGIFWQSDSGVGMSFSVGYRFHRLRYSNKEQAYNLDVDYNRLSVKFGIVIN